MYRVTHIIVLLLIISISYGQNCNGVTFDSPGEPSDCTFIFDNTGWKDSSGNPIGVPSNIGSNEKVCIYADNSDVLTASGQFQGTLYIAPGVTYSGKVNSFGSGSFLIVEGTADFSDDVGMNSSNVFIHENGLAKFPDDLNPGGSTHIKNLGNIEVEKKFSIGGSVLVTNYAEAIFKVGDDCTLNNTFNNCGYLRVEKDLETTGGSTLQNLCSSYVVGNFKINNDYVNDAFLMIDGDINMNGADLINDGTILVENITISNDNLIGNGESSVLIVKKDAKLSSGGSITGHFYYDEDDGGGFDSVCSGCTEDIYKLIFVDIPATEEQAITNCGEVTKPLAPVPFSTLDFDGVDDYVSTPMFIDGLTDVSMMGWVKTSSDNNGKNVTLFGEDDAFRVMLKSGNQVQLRITNTIGINFTLVGPYLPWNEWHHIAVTFSGLTGKANIYVDGELKASSSSAPLGLIGQTINGDGTFEIGRRSSNLADREYFKGAIDEVRVFDSVLNDEQIQLMVYQEIQEDATNVAGVVVPKIIEDRNTGDRIAWARLMAYYPMTNIISYERVGDYSSYKRLTRLFNINSVMEQTAPMPYIADMDGSWTDENIWKHGNVWDIEAINTNKPWSIVQIDSDVTTVNNHTQLGMIISEGGSLTVNSNRRLENNWYLELNGTIDLTGDSQLIQTDKSDLVTSVNGKILRRQSGNSNMYRYTYMSSPIGSQASTSLGNDNGIVNNPNNTGFSLNMLREGNGSPVQFTNAYHETGKISTYWTYSFLNGITYYDWTWLNPNSIINPGVGYIHKGTGNAGATQEYLFEGRPNNGTILIAADDVDGDASNESEADVTLTSILVGNPYPSAIDAHKFIDDNAGIIEGTLYLWQQWAGNSHNLAEYEGGYGILNKMTKVRAYQFVGMSGDTTADQNGTLTPTQYIGVGQSFMAEVINDGNIEFNNSQRIYKRESTGEVEFFRTSEKQQKEDIDPADIHLLRMELRLENDLSREIVIGFHKGFTPNYDYGYDAKMFSVKTEDMYTELGEHKMIGQAYPMFDNKTSIPLTVKLSGNQQYRIGLVGLENWKDEQKVYLKDKYTGKFHDLKTVKFYEFESEAGEFSDRFEIVFHKLQAHPTKELIDQTEIEMFFSNSSEKLFVKGLNFVNNNLQLIDLSGKIISTYNDITSDELYNGISIQNISSGIYMASLHTEDGQTFNKKIIIN